MQALFYQNNNFIDYFDKKPADRQEIRAHTQKRGKHGIAPKRAVVGVEQRQKHDERGNRPKGDVLQRGQKRAVPKEAAHHSEKVEYHAAEYTG
jgi:hypothetical protein